MSVLGIVLVLLGYMILVIAYGTYIKSIYSGVELAPNPFSWMSFALISLGNGLILIKKIDPIVSIFPFLIGGAQMLIAYLSYKKRKRLGEIHMSDVIALMISAIALGGWIYLNFQENQENWWLPLLIMLVADVVGFYPMIRDAWRHPMKEDPKAWLIFTLVGCLVLVGLWLKGDSSDIDLIYPAYETVLAVSTWLTLLFRRR